MLQHAHALTGMSHFRVELHAVKTALFIRHRSERTVRRLGNGVEAFRNGIDFIAMAHPNVQQRRTGFANRVFDSFK